MKLLFENWRRYLIEQDDATAPAKLGARKGLKLVDPADIKTPVPTGSPSQASKKKEIPVVQLSGEVQTHNAEELFHYFKSRSKAAAVFREGWDNTFAYGSWHVEVRIRVKELINYMVANNPVFHNNKIVDYLGAGSFGFVVELDNDHALKIFVGSFDPVGVDFGDWIDKEAESDVARYKGSQEKAFAGSGQTGELMIYDQGRIKTPFEKDWHYAEMQQLRTLSSWLRYVHKIDEFDAAAVKEFNIKLDAEIDALKLYADEHSWSAARKKSAKRFARWSIPQARFMDSLRYLDKKYAKNLLDQLKEILKTKTLKDIRDIRAANIGVAQQDESLPIIFDY